MIFARYIVAFVAALLMLTPGVCMCGCPCEMLLAGDAKPSDAGQAPTPSCCHPAAPASGPIVTAPQDCCCDAQRPQAAEDAQTALSSVDMGMPLLAAIETASEPFVVPVQVRTGHDPPSEEPVPSSTSLHVVLRS